MEKITYIMKHLALAAFVLLTACGPSEEDQKATAAAQTMQVVAIQETAVVDAMLRLTETEAAKPLTDTPIPPRSTDTQAVTPTPASLSLPTATNPLPGGSGGQSAMASETIPDLTRMTPGQIFTKTWKMRNTGTSTWSTDYALVFINGDQMKAKSEVFLPVPVPPGTLVDISVNMTAPSADGTYQGDWRLRDEGGKFFGAIVWAKIVVGPPLPTDAAPAAPVNTPTACPPYDPGKPFDVQSVSVYLNEIVTNPTNLSCNTPFNLTVSGAITVDNPGKVTYWWEIDGVTGPEIIQHMCGTTTLTTNAYINHNYNKGDGILINLNVGSPLTYIKVTGGTFTISCGS